LQKRPRLLEALDVDALQSLLRSDRALLDEQDDRDGFSLLHLAIDVEVDAHTNLGLPLEPVFTEMLLNAGVDPSLRSRSGETAREMAASRSYQSAVDLLDGRSR
jgi:hypothetical protein